MRRWIRNWLLRENNQPNSEAAINQLDTSVSPDISAYKISNGYLVRTTSRKYQLGEMRQDTLTYCKDHQAIADHLITQITRSVIAGEAEQLELPLGGNIVGNTYLSGNTVRSGKL
jgi:hypothetical protein